jgi:predicted nuclease of restriction endonuclease-like (RecB) superfamily
MSQKIDKNQYHSFLKSIKERILKAQYDALKVVNKELIALYWGLGKMIVEKQQTLGWGKSVVENLAIDLQKEFPGLSGFSYRNLWYMRNFYLTYIGNQKLQPLVAEISWTKNLIIIDRCKDELEKEFYMKMTKKFGWTKNVLVHQIDNQSYEKFLLGQTNFDRALPDKYRYQAKLAVKDEYTFDFLELGEEHSERELEIALVNNIRAFLIEMGGYFTFIGNQHRLEIEDREFFIDLLLYHRQLQCLIAIDMKIGKFEPEHAGKMQFYLNALNDRMKLEHENPSIGIILCKEKNRVVVEYALKDSNQPIGVATYKITRKLPSDLRKYLPTPQEIAKRLEAFKA